MSGHDSKYFSTTKKGEIPELKEELNSQYKDKRKDAVKKVFVAMTVGKDVSSLFTDAVNCMQTEKLELKKPVYLYLINYAKTQSDLAILAINTFVKGEDRDDRLMGNDASKIILVQLLVVFQCGALGFRKFRVKESQFLEFSVIGLEPFKSVKVQYGDDVRLSMPYVLPLPLLFFWISNMQQDYANKESRCTLKN
ncbi:hypothetical protein ACS0TY_028158 [Phlomoides rotata]